MIARKQFTNAIWAQASFLYSSLKGNYSGAIRQATGQTDPGINADYDYYQFTFNDYGNLELDRPVQARIDAVYNAPFGLSAGAQFYVRCGLPDLPSRMVQRLLPGQPLPRGARDLRPDPDRLRPEPLARLQHDAGPGDDHPAALRVQRPQPPDDHCGTTATSTSDGAIVTDPTSPFYGQPGVSNRERAPARPRPRLPARTTRTSSRTVIQTNPRLLRVALKVTF